MKTEYDYLLHLLGAYLHGNTPEQPENVDWEKLEELARIHTVQGILGFMAKKNPICPEGRKGEMRMLCLNTVSLFARRYALAQSFLEELDKAGIDHIVMKGFVFRELYPVPELRTFGDIDLVIRPAHREKCHALMTKLGYRVKNDWEPVYSYYRENELYEIHTSLLEKDELGEPERLGLFAAPWAYARKTQGHRWEFTPEFHFLYLLTHIAKHIYSSGAGARMYLDAAAFVKAHGRNMDWQQVAAWLEELKLTDFAGVVFTALELWFGVSVPVSHKKIPETLMEEFQKFTMEAGVFGHDNRRKVLSELKRTQTREPRAKQLLRRAFPGAKAIESRYTYLQDKPWLLPAAWVHRVVKNREALGDRAREAREIFSADEAEVQRLRRLMKEIGL